MITVQLKEFIKTGKFGEITLGSKKSDIIRLFGKKFDFADCGDTQIIKYGWYEFFYWTESELVFGMQNDHLANYNGNADVINFKNRLWSVDKWFLKDNEDITFAQVVEYLTEEKIPFEIIPGYDSNGPNMIKCAESNVKLDFSNEYHIFECDEKGEFSCREIVETDPSKFVLNGIRLFEY